ARGQVGLGVGPRSFELGRGRVRGGRGRRARCAPALRLQAEGRGFRRAGGRGDPLRRALRRGSVRLAPTPTLAL
ncbi:MAG: hypothetical protein AVDCRST_MAG05-2062, partial [uncultured Rubrobacteraceae bacterium]